MTDVRILGKGRRERVLPLWAETRSVLRDWLAVRPDASNTHLFVNARHQPMSRHGFANRLSVHVAKATKRAPTLSSKTVTPHVMRHSCAMHILEATGDIRKVSLWLGHSSIQTTEMYLRVDPAEKLDVLHASAPPAIRKGSFTGVSDRLISMLSDVHSRPGTRSRSPKN
jgi:integrase/recombinase XerD